MAVAAGVEAIARLTCANPGSAAGTAAAFVDTDHAGGHLSCDLMGALGAAEDGSAEAVGGVVGADDCFCVILHLHETSDGTEGLLADDFHLFLTAIEDGEWMVVPPEVLALEGDLSTIGDRAGQLLFNVSFLAAVDHGSDFDAFIAAVSDFDLFGEFYEAITESIGDLRLHVDTLGADTHLTGIAERVGRSELGGGFDVGVIENDQRILAAEFEDDSLQTAAGTLEDVSTRGSRASEGDEIHIRIHQSFPLFSISMHHLQNVFWEKGHQQVGIGLGDKGSFLRRLEDDAVARHESRHDGPVRHRHWKVPRRDAGTDPERIEHHRRRDVGILHRFRSEGCDHAIEGTVDGFPTAACFADPLW